MEADFLEKLLILSGTPELIRGQEGKYKSK